VTFSGGLTHHSNDKLRSHRRNRNGTRAAAFFAVELLENRIVLSATLAPLLATTPPALTANTAILPGQPASGSLAYGPDTANLLPGTPQLLPNSGNTMSQTQTHLTIVPTWDSTITSDPNAATIEATLNAAIQVYENYFADPITVNIYFEEMTSGLGESSTYYNTISYSSYRSSLQSHATTSNDFTALATLPNGSNNPVNGNSSLYVTTANARALGYSASVQYDSTIGLNTSICNLSRTSINPNDYDLMAVASHEMDEALGIGSVLNTSTNGIASPTGPVRGSDLYRYATPGVRSFNENLNATAYFSIDGGNTDLAQWSQVAGGDFNDWYSLYGVVIPQVQDAFSSPGATPNLNVELTELDVLGYTPITSAPTVNTQPVSQTATAGNAVTLYATALGSPTPFAQWQISTNGGSTYTNISGATSDAYTFTAATGQNGYLYRVLFNNSQGSVYSNAATLTVNATASLDLQPYTPSGWTAPLVLTTGTSNFTGLTTFTSSQTVYASFCMANFGPAATTATTYLEVLLDGGIVAGGSVGASFPASEYTYWSYYSLGTLTPGSHTLEFYVNYNGRVAETNTSNDTYSVTVNVTASAAAATILEQPQSAAVPSGSTVGFTAIATGSPAPTEQWQVSINNGTSYSNISGATSPVYSLTASAGNNGYLYRAAFTNASGTVNSSAATLTVTTAVSDLAATYTPPTWSSPLVLSTTSGTYTNATSIASNQTIYVDTAFINNGPGTAATGIVNDVVVDGTLATTFSTTSTTPSGSSYQDANIAVGPLSAGLHTIAVVANYNNAIAESNYINDAVVATFTVTQAPVSVTSVVVNGNIVALAGAQRSMVDSIVYTFSEAVKVAATGAFTIAVHTGEQGTAPTLAWAAISPDGNGASPQWVVTFTGASVIGNSIANGVYDITLNASDVTSEAHPTATITPRATDTFYRLYGDYNGDQVVNATDNLHFKTAITTYNPIFDYDNNGAVNATDNLHFKASISFVFNASFTTTI
jgi:hypothetical protein